MQRSTLNRIFLPPLILMAVVICVFSQTLRNDFVNWDDQSEIVQNPDFNPVSWHGLMWNWSHHRLSLYMPVTYMVWGGAAAIGSRQSNGMLSPFAFHALNLALHGINASLMFVILLQLFKQTWPAFLGALAFAVHPLQAEPVAWASGMYTLLSCALSLAALLAYLAYVRASGATRNLTAAIYFCVGIMLYCIALLTKAASVSLPLAAGAIDFFILQRPFSRVAKSLWIWVVLGIPAVLLAKYFQDLSQITEVPLWVRPAIGLDSIGFYLRKIVWPVDLIPDYGRNPNWVMQHPAALGVSLLIALSALLLAWTVRRTAVWLTAGIGLIVAGVSPYLGLTAFDFQYVSTVADRYAYFGLIGLAMLFAGIAARFRMSAVLLLALIFCWVVLTHKQVSHWRDTDTLFNYTLAVNPNSLVSHNVFGYIAASRHQYAEAEMHYLKALRIWPEDATIQFNLGNLYFRSSPERALERYELAVKYQPRFVLYRNSLAAALARTGRLEEAYDQWALAVRLDPSYIDARNNLADLLANIGRTTEAEDEYREVLLLNPQNRHALQRLGQLDGSHGK